MLCVDFTYLKPDTALVRVLNFLSDSSFVPTGHNNERLSDYALNFYHNLHLNIIGKG